MISLSNRATPTGLRLRSTLLLALESRLVNRIKTERDARGWSLGDPAERSGVSKAMISKIERRESSPTATLLGHLSGADGLTVSTLLARAGAPCPP